MFPPVEWKCNGMKTRGFRQCWVYWKIDFKISQKISYFPKGSTTTDWIFTFWQQLF
jgi:hypothetical protein